MPLDLDATAVTPFPLPAGAAVAAAFPTGRAAALTGGILLFAPAFAVVAVPFPLAFVRTASK